ncbi:MAG: hypothetical protein KGJ23_12655 [Euryarchaeota archaeon]|nr:hypothetical protein [Euryarchaeota archaeon]MDE2045585.1 hypothetical protein [Thermoplasmata archaeon]
MLGAVKVGLGQSNNPVMRHLLLEDLVVAGGVDDTRDPRAPVQEGQRALRAAELLRPGIRRRQPEKKSVLGPVHPEADGSRADDGEDRPLV